jgi:hypothetical protein
MIYLHSSDEEIKNAIEGQLKEGYTTIGEMYLNYYTQILLLKHQNNFNEELLEKNKSLGSATWILALATWVLAIATIILVIVDR